MKDFMHNLETTLTRLKDYSVSVMETLTGQPPTVIDGQRQNSDEIIMDTSPHVLITGIGKYEHR